MDVDLTLTLAVVIVVMVMQQMVMMVFFSLNKRPVAVSAPAGHTVWQLKGKTILDVSSYWRFSLY